MVAPPVFCLFASRCRCQEITSDCSNTIWIIFLIKNALELLFAFRSPAEPQPSISSAQSRRATHRANRPSSPSSTLVKRFRSFRE